jgi:uncharacterized protein YkwD
MKRRIAVFTCAAALVAAIWWALPANAPAAPHLSTYERQSISLINKQRARHGLACLRLNAQLQRAARAHSAEMSARRYFSHNSANGETCAARIIGCGYSRAGYRQWAAGECIYWGAGQCARPVVVVDQWMASPEHRRVILTRSLRDFGVGVVERPAGFAGSGNPAWFFTLDVGRRAN